MIIYYTTQETPLTEDTFSPFDLPHSTFKSQKSTKSSINKSQKKQLDLALKRMQQHKQQQYIDQIKLEMEYATPEQQHQLQLLLHNLQQEQENLQMEISTG